MKGQVRYGKEDKWLWKGLGMEDSGSACGCGPLGDDVCVRLPALRCGQNSPLLSEGLLGRDRGWAGFSNSYQTQKAGKGKAGQLGQVVHQLRARGCIWRRQKRWGSRWRWRWRWRLPQLPPHNKQKTEPPDP